MSDPQTTVRSLTPGYRLNPQTAQRALYRLATMLLSYSGFKKADGRPLALQEQFLDDELSHLLPETAMANRLQWEHMEQLRDDPHELSFNPVECHCGEWVSPKEAEPLEFEDACNKIIHAQEIRMTSFDHPTLYLSGYRDKKRKKPWVVTVDLLRYFELSARNFEDALSWNQLPAIFHQEHEGTPRGSHFLWRTDVDKTTEWLSLCRLGFHRKVKTSRSWMRQRPGGKAWQRFL